MNACARRHPLWASGVLVLSLASLTSCLVVVSTSPTALSGATIVFVATDDRGDFVELLHVSLFDTAGDWRVSGVTAPDGSFRCGVGAGISRVRVDVVPPAGYTLATPESWPRHVDVPASGSVRVEVRIRRSQP